jgi:WD40 repeat protein
VLHVTFNPAGTLLAVAASGAEKSVRLWDVTAPGEPVRVGEPIEGPTGLLNFADFSADGKSLAVASSDNKVWVWELATRRVIALLPHPAPVTEVRFLGAGGRLVSTAEDGTTRVWTLPGPLITEPKDTVFTAAIGSDGRRLLVGADGSDRTVRLWDIADLRHPVPLSPPMRAPTGKGLSGAAAQSPDGRTVAAGTLDGPVHLWDVSDPGRPVPLEHALLGADDIVESVAFSPDSRTVAAAGDDDKLRLWDVTDPRRPAALATLDDPGGNVFATTFSADGRLIAAGSGDKNAYLWDVGDRAHPVRMGPPLGGHTQEVYSVALSPRAGILAAGSADKTIRLWDIRDPRHPRPLGKPLTGPNNVIYWLSFSPDGNILAAGSGDGTVWLWDMRDPERASTYANLAGLSNSVWMVSFSPDGTIVAAGGADKSVRLWTTDPARVAAHICAVAGDPITATEWSRHLPELPYDPPC